MLQLWIGLHSFIDGVIYSIAFTRILTGVLGTMGMVLHEFPEGIITYFVLMVMVICFVEHILNSFHEAFRVLNSGGSIIVGFMDREKHPINHPPKNRPPAAPQGILFRIWLTAGSACRRLQTLMPFMNGILTVPFHITKQRYIPCCS